jgi:hypothetical protein
MSSCAFGLRVRELELVVKLLQNIVLCQVFLLICRSFNITYDVRYYKGKTRFEHPFFDVDYEWNAHKLIAFMDENRAIHQRISSCQDDMCAPSQFKLLFATINTDSYRDNRHLRDQSDQLIEGRMHVGNYLNLIASPAHVGRQAISYLELRNA